MLSNAYFLAKFRFDTAENEPAKNFQIWKFCQFCPLFLLPDPSEVHGVIERIVERESLKASELLLTNGQAQADVIARLQVTCLLPRAFSV